MRVQRSEALKKTCDVLEMLEDTTTRIHVAGSLRRGAEDVKDGELVALSTNRLLWRTDQLVKEGKLGYATYQAGTRRWGEKMRGMLYQDFKVELFMADMDNIGVTHWLRTGPATENHEVVSLLWSTPLRMSDGYLWWGENWTRRGERWYADIKRKVHVPDEESFFEALGVRYVEERERDQLPALLRKAIKSKRVGKYLTLVEETTQIEIPNQSTLF